MGQAVIYVRVSSREQVGNTSLVSQEASCRDWCERNRVTIARVFKEQGESAKTTDRTEFQAMFRYLERERENISYLVVDKFDRFGRNVQEDATYKLRLRNSEIKLVSVKEPTDNTPSGELTESMLGILAQFDNQTRAIRAKDGMKSRAASGRFVWRAPLGYVNSRSKTGPSLLVDQGRASLIRQFFELVASGKGISDALRHVNALGLRTVSGQPVSAWTAKKWLSNPIYMGYIQSRCWGTYVRGDFEPIISESLFRKVQLALQGRQMRFTPHRRKNEKFPLRGSLICPACGRPATASTSKGKTKRFSYYHCHRGPGHLRIRSTIVESAFLALLDQLQPEPHREKLIAEIFRRVWNEKQAAAQQDQRALHAELQRLEAKKARLLSDRSDGLLDREDFEKPFRKVKEEIAAVQVKIEEGARITIDVDTAVEYLLHTLWNSRNTWESADFGLKLRLARLIFPEGFTFSNSGFGTPVTHSLFTLLGDETVGEGSMVRPERFELPT